MADDKAVKLEPGRGKESHKLWMSRMRSTLQWRMQYWNGDKAWNRYTLLVRGKHWGAGTGNDSDEVNSESPRDRITVNMTGSLVQDMLAFLVNDRPVFIGKPRKPESSVAAKLKVGMLNYFWREQSMQKQIKRAVRDGISIGHGIVRTGYTLEVDATKTPDKSGLIEYSDFVRADYPYVRRVNPRRFLIDPEAPENDLETARWCAEIFFKPTQDVVKNENYDADVRAGILSGKYSPTTRDSFLSTYGSGSKKIDNADDALTVDADVNGTSLITLYEVWDKKFRKVRVYADGIDEPLRETEWPYTYLDGLPYVKYDFIELADELYGQGLPGFVEDQQHELNRLRTAQFNHRRRFSARKYTVDVDRLVDEGELTKLTSGEDGTVVRGRGRDVVVPIQDAPLPNDTLQVEAAIKEDFRTLTGADQLLQGGNLPSRTSATEVRTRAALIGLKIDDRVTGVDDFVHAIGRQVLQHIAGNVETDQVIRVEGKDGEQWIKGSPADIRAEIDLELTSTSADRVDPMLERQQAMSIFTTTVQNLQLLAQAGTRVDINELFRWVMEKFGEKEIFRFFSSEPMQMNPTGVDMMGAQSGGPGAPPSAAVPPTPGDPRAAATNSAAAPLQSSLSGALMGALGGNQE